MLETLPDLPLSLAQHGEVLLEDPRTTGSDAASAEDPPRIIA